jgi:nitrous oxide reductase accessory protein NosL
MKYAFFAAVAVLSLGCQSTLNNIFEIAATPEELASMTAIDVCKHYGYAQWRNQPQAYLDAKKEASKRIESGQVDSDDCMQFARMAVREKEAAKEQMYRAEEIRKSISL